LSSSSSLSAFYSCCPGLTWSSQYRYKSSNSCLGLPQHLLAFKHGLTLQWQPEFPDRK